MTIRRRLTVSFLAILFLFGLDLFVYFWGKHQLNTTVEVLRRAISRQLLVTSIHQDLNNDQKEVALLSEVAPDAARGGAGPEQIAQFAGRLQAIAKQIEQLRDLSDAQERVALESMAKDYQTLSAAWRTFYENFGVNQSKAILALATVGDPLSQRLVQQVLPQLQDDEKLRVDVATANFNRVGALTDRISIVIFLVPTIIAALVAFRVSRHLAGGLEKLLHGAAQIGQLQLGHRIDLNTRDELGDLARSYNSMADNLETARAQLNKASEEMGQRNKELEQERSTSEMLLLNILPIQVAKELKDKGNVDPKYFEDVTIIFTDFVGFTLSTEKLAAEDLVYALNDYFTLFDKIVGRYYMEKLKTIGDSYMYVGGLPLDRQARRSSSHPVDAVMAAFEMVRAVEERAKSTPSIPWAVRVGVHTGPVIAGVVGIQKFAFDIWGESVNTASRMESSGMANHINMSYQTFVRVKDFFDCEYRGKIPTKDKRDIDMYLANGLLPTLLGDGTQIPPEAFLRRYRVYFQKEPPSFPFFMLPPAAAP